METAEIETVEPQSACKILENNTTNRSVRDSVVNKLARDMKAGDWTLNGSAIVISNDGRLLDGQHRLWACVQADRPFRTLVVRGVEPEAMDTIDTGTPRRLTDVFKIRGEKYSKELSTICRVVTEWEAGSYGGSGQGGGKGQFSVREMERVLERYPWVRDGCAWLSKLNDVRIPSRISGLAYWMFMQIDEEDTDWFLDHLWTGSNLDMDHPILTLRQGFLSKPQYDSRPRHWWAAVTFKAWNHYRSGEQMKRLSYRAGGAKPEKFPKPE